MCLDVFALICIFMLVAYGARGSQFTAQIRFRCSFGIALRAYNYFDVSLVKDFYRASAHTAGDNDLDPAIMQEYGQVARLVAIQLSGTTAQFR